MNELMYSSSHVKLIARRYGGGKLVLYREIAGDDEEDVNL